MSFDVKSSITGLQEAQRANLKALAALRPDGALGRAVLAATLSAHRFAVANTPWDYGALRAAHRVRIEDGGARGVVSIDPSASHPRHKTPPSRYGPILHARGMRPGLRGGIRAFYQYTKEHDGPTIARQALTTIRRGLP